MVTRMTAALLCVALAGTDARGEPCKVMVGLPAGAAAPCDGVLVPPDYPDACSSVTSSLMSCRRRVAGLRAEHAIELAERDARLGLVEAARQAEREACRAYTTAPPATDWTAVAWGVVAGLVAGGLIVGGAVALGR